MNLPNDSLSNKPNPAFALLTKKTPFEIAKAWKYIYEHNPNELFPKYNITIEITFGRSCCSQDIHELMNDLAGVVGFLQNNQAKCTLSGNVLSIEAKLFRGYETEIADYLRNMMTEYINSPKNKFIAAIGFRKDGPDPFKNLNTNKLSETNVFPGYFQVYNKAMYSPQTMGINNATNQAISETLK